MIVFKTAPSLPNLRFLCLFDYTDWAAKPGEYTISRETTDAESYAGAWDGSFDAANVNTLTSCDCPVCGKTAYHGVIYSGSMESSTESASETQPSSESGLTQVDTGTETDDLEDTDGTIDIETKSIQLAFEVTAGSSYTYENDEITADMAVTALRTDSGVQGGEWDIQTNDGSLTITGTISAAGTVTIVLAQAGIDPDTLYVFKAAATSDGYYLDDYGVYNFSIDGVYNKAVLSMPRYYENGYTVGGEDEEAGTATVRLIYDSSVYTMETNTVTGTEGTEYETLSSDEVSTEMIGTIPDNYPLVTITHEFTKACMINVTLELKGEYLTSRDADSTLTVPDTVGSATSSTETEYAEVEVDTEETEDATVAENSVTVTEA